MSLPSTSHDRQKEAMTVVSNELESLNSLMTVLVIVLILFVILQVIQTVLKVIKPKQKMGEKNVQPNAVVVQGRKETRTSKRESHSHKSSSRRGSLPSKRLSTVLSLSTESECEKTGKSSKEQCTGSRESCTDKKNRSDTSIPPLEMSKEMAASLKMLNCSDVVNTPLPSTAPLAVPHTPSKSTSKESIEDSTKEKKKQSPTKTAPTQPSLHAIPTTPIQAPPTQAPPLQTTPASVATATKKSPGVDSTQRGSVIETLTPGPKKNSPVKTGREDVKATPTPAPATIPPLQ